MKREAATTSDANPANGDVCTECGRGAADKSRPRVEWLSWRRLLPLVLLVLATTYATMMAVPMTREILMGKDNSLSNNSPNVSTSKYTGKGGFLLNIHPHHVTPQKLAAMADGTGPTDELRAMVEEVVALGGFTVPVSDPQSEMMLSVGAASARVDEKKYFGMPFNYMYTYEGDTYENYFDGSHVPRPLTEKEYDFALSWTTLMRADAADERFGWVGVSWMSIAAAIGLGWFVYTLVSLCTRRRWVRVTVMLGYVVLMGLGSGATTTSTDITGFGPHPPLTPTGVARDEFLGSADSDSQLRELAGKMLAAIPEGTAKDGIVYLGHRTPISYDWWQGSLGPIVLNHALGYYGSTTYFHIDERGNRLGPATLDKLPRVRFYRNMIHFMRVRGNSFDSLSLWPTTVVLYLTILGLVFSIPRWCFVVVANRRHKKRLRLALCCGCGYALPGKPSEA